MYGIIVFILILISALFLNTLRFRKKNRRLIRPYPFEITPEVIQKFKKAISIKTVTHSDYEKNNLIEFQKFQHFIREMYPTVSSRLEMNFLSDYSCVISWTGRKKSLKPVLLIAHYDVVPVVEDEWSVNPFEGVEKEGFIWGRGTLDTKNTLTAILESVEVLLNEGFVPDRTVYMAFGGDEETQGTEGAGRISTYFKEQEIEFDWLLDEGGVVAENSFSMVQKPLALIGISEKGYVNLKVSSKGQGGHSSMPPAHTAAGLVSRAVSIIENNPFRASITPTIRAFLLGITPEVSFPIAIIMANHRLFAPIIKFLLLKNPSSAALIRTTQAVTIMSAGTKENVLPSSAEAIINYRILPGESVSSVLKRTQNLLKNKKVQVEVLNENDSNDPIEESSINTEAFHLIDEIIQGVFPGSLTVPYMMTGATDSKHYKNICDNIYRFSPMSLSSDEISLIHSADERISVENYKKAIQFYITVLKNI